MSSSVDFRVSLDDSSVVNRQTLQSLEERQLYGRVGDHTTNTLIRSVTTVEQSESNVQNADKLGTFDGVFIPTTLNVLSILMFLRFGFLLGQAGILGILLLLILSYGIDLLTTLSISAISTNGTVRGGGAYYMISRSLGPEFGGSIGIVFYIGQVLNTGMNLVGFCDPLFSIFGTKSGELFNVLPEGRWWLFLYSSILLVIVTSACTVGSKFFARSSKILFVVLMISTISVPLSVFFVKPYSDSRFDNKWYTGLSWTTFKDNLLPRFTTGAAGSETKSKENFQNMFGILFPATSGIFAGASMSGDLKQPSKSISRGTLWGLAVTFGLYIAVIIAIGASVSRPLLYRDVSIMQHSNISVFVVLIGELSTSFFSALMGIFGASKLLQAISMDDLIKGTSLFSWENSSHNPLYAIALSYVLTQVTLFFDINQIAVFITMAYLMTFTVTNLACFLLKIASAPNFRPSFRYFNSHTAFVGTVASVVAMFVADGVSASAMIMCLIALFLMIHYMSPAKPWGDVSQTLIYHQVRKYLLRLRQDHVKFWRPQILLLVDDPRNSWSLMQFCNHLKKGGLYILGHVIVTNSFHDDYPEIQKQKTAWNRLRESAKIKGFVQISASPDIVWGVRNVYMGSGLGGMKPNITVLGFYELSHQYPQLAHKNYHVFTPEGSDARRIDVDTFPTDICRKERGMTIQEWVNIIEDLMTMQATVAVAKGFPKIQFPTSGLHSISSDKGFIDLYPIQMSAQITDETGEKSALATNFDTYMLTLQLGAILHTVPAWKEFHILRVIAFVEFEEEVATEKKRISILLDKLRIEALVEVVCLSKEVNSYQTIVNGASDVSGKVTELLGDDEWWRDMRTSREEFASQRGSSQIPVSPDTSQPVPVGMSKIFRKGNGKRRFTMSQLGVSYSMQTNKLLKSDLNDASPWSSDNSDSENEIPNSTDISKVSSPELAAEEQGSTKSRNKMHLHPGFPVSKPPLAKHFSSSHIASEKAKAKKLKPHFTGHAVRNFDLSGELEGAESSATSIADSVKSRNSPRPSSDERTPLLSDNPLSRKLSHGSDSFLSFNDLPAKAQHVILNDVMLKMSGKSAVIFSTLPAPSPGAYLSEQDSLDYVQSLDMWCRDLPPMMLLNCQTMTVTTAL